MYTAYIAHPDFVPEVRVELRGQIVAEQGRLFVSKSFSPSVFALDIWPDSHMISIASIGAAVKTLRPLARCWMHYPVNNIRRGTLITEQLRQPPIKTPLDFPPSILPEIAVFCLLNQNTLLYCLKPWKKIPGGEYVFKEDKINPPNRAYLKLWEALTLLGKYPKPGELCIDLGASPGGWTWVLQRFGAHVIAVDKAPLAPHILRLPNVTQRQQSAFALDPKEFQKVDWLVADIACYPERLLALIQNWLTAGNVKQMICTVKLQGETDFNALHPFQEIPNSTIAHLWHNKHELTFFCRNT